MQGIVYTGLHPLKAPDEVSWEVVIGKYLFNILLLWTGLRLALLVILQVCLFWVFILVLYLFYGPLFSVLSILLWKFLWLNEELLTLFCLFIIMRMEISWFLWEIYCSSLSTLNVMTVWRDASYFSMNFNIILLIKSSVSTSCNQELFFPQFCDEAILAIIHKIVKF
jgi:hypothetical protein